MVRLLTQAGANPNKADKDGKTPLMLASSMGNMRLVAALRPQAITMSDLD